MPRVRYKPSAVGPYSGATGVWQPGEIKDVSEKDAAWLLGPQAAWFEAVEERSEAVADAGEKGMDAPPRSKPFRGRKKGA